MLLNILIALATFLCMKSCVSQQFDRHFTGVTFMPYIKLRNNDSIYPDKDTYTRQDIRMMLEVITERFSKVATWTSGSNNVSYISNVTYHNQSSLEVNIAEIAASINKERGKQDITLHQGVWFYNGPQMTTETKLAIECAEKANQIFPETVEGVVFTHSLENHDEELLKHLKMAKNESTEKLKFGVRMHCQQVFKEFSEDNWKVEKLGILGGILKNSDFIVCQTNPEPKIVAKGAAVAFHSISDWLLKFREKVHNISNGIEVMGQVKWTSEGDLKWEIVDNLKIYWEVASQWAKINNFPIWFFEAFDSPEVKFHNGWWRLTDNSKIDKRDGYIEKVLEGVEPSAKGTATLSAEVVASIVVGLVVFIILLSSIIFLVFRVNRLQQQLSNKDIREFMNGKANEHVLYESEHDMTICALKFPYDKALEIKKHQLRIQHEKLLGVGQYGYVVKAVIDKPPEALENVALKMAKADSSLTALKGLLSEIKILSYIGKHPNIVALVGAYTAELHKSTVYIATEFCSLGSLQGYLRGQKKHPRGRKITDLPLEDDSPSSSYIRNLEPISFRQMLQWSRDIACGMEYLGTRNVVHADLATRNVLLNEEKVAKICDFGLSRRMYEYTNYVKSEQEPLPWRWMAVESLNLMEFSVKSDVWSYGVTLWEIFSMGIVFVMCDGKHHLGNSPYAGLAWTVDFATMLMDGLQLGQPSHATPEIYQLMVDCWSIEPVDRPSFSEIHEIIKHNIIKWKETA